MNKYHCVNLFAALVKERKKTTLSDANIVSNLLPPPGERKTCNSASLGWQTSKITLPAKNAYLFILTVK